ncbi:MAG: hypothetical protein Q9174_005223, partial [Haloplaca sp. 1 TL-2023]
PRVILHRTLVEAAGQHFIRKVGEHKSFSWSEHAARRRTTGNRDMAKPTPSANHPMSIGESLLPSPLIRPMDIGSRNVLAFSRGLSKQNLCHNSLRPLIMKRCSSVKSPPSKQKRKVKRPKRCAADPITVDWNKYDGFFQYTKNRFVFNEAKELADRRVQFDMNALIRIVAACTGSRSGTCRHVEKYGEGQFNKVFLMVTVEGKEVVAKVPQPNAGRPYFTTASEVTTMDYVRNVLDLPVPKVLAWSADASQNAVGAEYIIMEKAAGVELSNFWEKLAFKQKRVLIEDIVRMEKSFTSSAFPAFGSLYYAHQLDAKTTTFPVTSQGMNTLASSEHFVIGPTTDRHSFADGRGKIQCDRGPWPNLPDYLQAIGTRELTCVQNLTKFPTPAAIFGGPGWYQPTVARKISVLKDYIKVARHLCPQEPTSTAAIIWHEDLHSGNIFVDPDNPTKITSIIDWQCTHVAPLFRHARTPKILAFGGTKVPLGLSILKSAITPQVPDNFGELSADQQREVKQENNKLKQLRIAYKSYEMLSGAHETGVYDALLYQQTLEGQLIESAGSTINHTEPITSKLLLHFMDDWEEVHGCKGISCPLSYSERDRDKFAADFKGWCECLALFSEVCEGLEVHSDWDGSVGHDDFTAVKERVDQMRTEFLNQMAKSSEERLLWNEAWPFKDEESQVK